TRRGGDHREALTGTGREVLGLYVLGRDRGGGAAERLGRRERADLEADQAGRAGGEQDGRDHPYATRVAADELAYSRPHSAAGRFWCPVPRLDRPEDPPAEDDEQRGQQGDHRD